jgi:hypothetical protein
VIGVGELMVNRIAMFRLCIGFWMGRSNWEGASFVLCKEKVCIGDTVWHSTLREAYVLHVCC